MSLNPTTLRTINRFATVNDPLRVSVRNADDPITAATFKMGLGAAHGPQPTTMADPDDIELLADNLAVIALDVTAAQSVGEYDLWVRVTVPGQQDKLYRVGRVNII